MSSILSRERVAYYCTVLLIAALAVQVLSLVKDREIGGDFMTLYAAGKVALNYPHSQLYDLDVQEKEYARVSGTNGHSPFGYTPWFAMPLAILARFPYLVAFGIWTLLSVAFLLIAYWLMSKTEGFSSSWRYLGFMACLTFPPYLFYSLINGHPTAFALLVLAAAYFLQKTGRCFLAGIVLAFLTYKPTLLVFIGPMLLFTRQWKILAGLFVGGSSLALVGIVWAGLEANIGFLRLMKLYTQAINSSAEIFQTDKYIDLGAAIRLLIGPHALIRPVLLILSFPLVCFLWYRLGSVPVSWSLAIVSGLLFNIYTPIYDCTLLIFAMILIGVRSLDSWLVVAIYLVPLLTVPLARATGFQLYTAVLVAVFVLLARRSFTPQPSRSYA